MSLDLTKPAAGTKPRSAEIRNNFIALKGISDDLQNQIGSIQPIPGPPGSDGAPGANGADGRSINPRGIWNDAETYNRLDLVSHDNALYICTEDGTSMATPGSDPRWLAAQIAVNNGDGPIIRITGRNSGADQSAFGIDGAGVTGNMGMPSVQPNAILRWDDTISAYRPWNVTVQTEQVMGADGNPRTITFLAPPA